MRRGGARGGAGKNAEKKGTKGKKSFEDYFLGIYGKKRWPVLKAALLSDKTQKVALINKWAAGVHNMEEKEREPIGDCGAAAEEKAEEEKEGASVTKKAQQQDMCPVPALQGLGLQRMPSRQLQLWAQPDGGLMPPPMKESQSTEGSLNGTTLPYYIFDYASALNVEALGVEELHKVLDLCAAPGGKSVAIGQFLNGQGGGHLTANEKSHERCARLKRTLQDYLPRDAAAPYEVIMRDGNRYHAPSTYDRILLDAPCSSERHLLAGAGGFDVSREWSPEYSAKMATVQKSLLVMAIEMLKVGGIMTYSTCSISPQENDQVVQYALDRTRCHVHLEETQLRIGEATGMGWIVLPDLCEGAGPLYVATLKKVAEARPIETSSEDDSDDSDE